MPIFSGAKRPRLDGLTREEEKRRDALSPEIERRGAAAGAGEAVLREKMAAEPADPLWPLLLGGQMIGLGRYGKAIEAFDEAIARDGEEVRGYYGAGLACYRAAEHKQAYGAASSTEAAPDDLTVDNLYQEALRYFRRAMELTPDKRERGELASSAATVVRALGRKRGRL